MYTPAKERYETMEYNRCGESGLMLPKVSLGLWHNFGDTSDYENMKQLCFTAFDNGITQFDLANKLRTCLWKCGTEFRQDPERRTDAIP